MFSKLVKNEFVNRWKSILSIYGALLGASLIMLIMTKIYQGTSSNFFQMLYGLYAFLYVLLLLISFASVFFLPLADFRKRFFKDQGYLTHTLPVKTSTLLMSRMVCDLSMLLGMAIVYPLSICIAAGNFDFFTAVGDVCGELFEMIGFDASVGLTVLLTLLLMLVAYLYNLWVFNCSYAMGHCLFRKGKRIMSVVIFLAILLVSSLVSSAVSNALQDADLTGTMVSSSHYSVAISTLNTILLIWTLFMIVGTGVLVAVTNWVFHKHLNLD